MTWMFWSFAYAKLMNVSFWVNFNWFISLKKVLKSIEKNRLNFQQTLIKITLNFELLFYY